MTNAETIRFVVGIIGQVTSFILFASPAPTIWRIFKTGFSEEFLPDPYIATILNCALWIFYGQPFVTPDQTLVVTINSIGLAMEICYLIVFFLYTDKKRRWRIVIALGMEALMVTSLVVGMLCGVSNHTTRSTIVGAVCVVFGIIMYASPLTKMLDVIKTKSVEYMPFWISVGSFLNGCIWLSYGLIKFDRNIVIGNGTGAVLGASQLLLYAIYFKRSSTPKKDDVKPSELQLV